MTASKNEVPEMTLDEALKQLAAISKRLEEVESATLQKDAVIAQQAGTIKEMKAQEEGWMVKTPSAAYNETLLGVKFTNGLAFIPRTRAFPQFEYKPMNDEQRERYLAGFQEKKRAKAAEDLARAEARTTAEIVAHQLQYDWQFEVEWIGADRLDFVQTTASARAREAALEQQRIKEELEKASALVRPGVLPGRA